MLNCEVLVAFIEEKINAFAAAHPEETFCAFAIDGQLLCLNTEFFFEEKLHYYTETASDEFRPFYEADGFREQLWKNPGDWKYQGFAHLTEEAGLDKVAYYEYLDMSPEEQRASEYTFAMQQVLDELNQRGAFKNLNCAPSFTAFLVNRAENE
ncbi:DUF4303 domain-containing protein [Armatimonas rosea]|uniref:DUF4303 domain-containing protein n=1 Tax=Armatimonas rosea TaxID=685828 RepID=A0A7W9W7G7_ARMRO|nr:DUF4303 domain-containing protein [Armatimonas rosea]MBB6050612.1 hypothetical protein [Armatimonas rosea]